MAIVVLALVVAISTVAITPSVSRREWPSVGYGYPFHFVRSNADWMPPPRKATEVPFNPWENPTRVDDAMLIASVVVIAAIPLGLRGFFDLRRRRRPA
jgi:hypothetical protein